MPSAVRAAATPQHTRAPSQKKFRTVLGFGTVFKDVAHSRNNQPLTVGHSHNSFSRGSLDTGARSYRLTKKNRADRSSVTDVSFFEPDSTDVSTPNIDEKPDPVLTATPTMKTLDASNSRALRRPPVRMDAQDGPWSVSVAETPHDARSSYSLYIKTPTHNLTLTRTANEIVELHQKLRESHPGGKLPKLPIDTSSLPAAPPAKRKSNFLNTLSRLASPSAGRSTRHAHNHRHSNNSSAIPSTLPTPLTSPSREGSDPFTSLTNGSAPTVNTANSMITGLAAYLTTISNEPTLNQARVWKRFVRVRTDDLESVRVERAIKRVRSDLAAHISPKAPPPADTLMLDGNGGISSPASVSEVESIDGSIHEEMNGDEIEVDEREPSVNGLREEGILEEDEDDAEVIMEPLDGEIGDTEGATTGHDARPDSPRSMKPSTVVEDEVPARSAPIDISPSISSAPEDDEEIAPSTPVASDHPMGRIPRSQSADPDKASRLSRVYTHQDGASSQTGDESSVSTTAGRPSARKKRSRSSDPSKDSSSKKKSHRKVVIDDFEMMRVLGKGCAGKVLLVRHKSTTDLYALKAITKRHVLAHQELQHTLTEQAVLKKMAAESKDPFVVKLWWSFHDKENLFLVMDFHPGGDLATQLARWGRLGRDRARFYAAEIVEGVEGLHAAGVIYRDLKPENILIGADGHIVLTDFGLSKEFPRRTAPITAPATPSGSRNEFYSSVPGTPQPSTPPWMKGENGHELASGWPGQPVGQGDSTSTFCGTAEYLAPEVIQGLPYSYEVDWWSFGTMLYEMLTGITPFWANNHSDMYVRVLQDELQFPDDRAIDQDTKSLIRGLLQRNPGLRMCEPRIKKHPYFSMIDWSHVYYKRYIPPYIPPIDPSNASDTQNFDETFLDMEPVIDDGIENDQTDTDQEREQTDTDRTDGEESNTTPSQSRSSSVHAKEDESVDVFDGYSFKGRHSVIIDGDDEESDADEEEDEEEEEEGEGEGEGEGEEPLVADSQHDISHVAEVTPSPLPVNGTLAVDEDISEPKTPEARPAALPEATGEIITTPTEAPISGDTGPKAPDSGEGTPRRSAEAAPVAAKEHKETKPKAPVSSKGHGARPSNRSARPRKEKSGVPALDRYLSDTIDEEVTEREDEDDDWDIVEAADGEDRNGAKGNSLFARGVVDRYRLAVFRKASTPSQRSGPRSVSGMSKASDLETLEPADSPSPSEKQRRGRTPGLTFRKHPRQFLRAKSPPPSTRSAKSSTTAKTLSHSTSATLSASSTPSSGGMLTPSPSMGSTLPPSLKSKESAVSVGAHSISSDQSGNGDANGLDGRGPAETVKSHPPISSDEPEKHKPKKLKKYKEGAEKVFSLFQSPRPQP